jgi:hypothetical protein
MRRKRRAQIGHFDEQTHRDILLKKMYFPEQVSTYYSFWAMNQKTQDWPIKQVSGDIHEERERNGNQKGSHEV